MEGLPRFVICIYQQARHEEIEQGRRGISLAPARMGPAVKRMSGTVDL